jgi:hypothetical protein
VIRRTLNPVTALLARTSGAGRLRNVRHVPWPLHPPAVRGPCPDAGRIQNDLVNAIDAEVALDA